MDRCSYFIEGRALFGSCPNNDDLPILERVGVRYFIDLTYPNEKNASNYDTRYIRICYPIEDKKVPTNWYSFSKLIVQICNIIKGLKNEEKIYVHCKGGHGRSGVVVACVLAYYFKFSAHQSLLLTNHYHNQRKVMRDKWRIVGSPQTQRQKTFVYSFCSPILFNELNYPILCNYSNHPIYVKSLGETFACVEAAYQAHRNLDAQYIKNLTSAVSEKDIILLRDTIEECKDWKEKRDNIMYFLVKEKFDRDPLLKTFLINTCLRPLIYKSNSDSYWKDMTYNRFGKLLEKIREEYLN